MGIDELLKEKREEILAIAAKHGDYNVRVFGSVARGEANDKSDVVEIEQGRTLLDQISLIQRLEDLLGRKVDVAEPENLHKLIKDRVLKEAILL
ncbi:nucleotidyltransferase domain-containing protein [Cyanobacteria bacterium FACHB-471]|nr:nucleotidyltransferase domain-containing protein [Cyanobacteria bacterium FACHB-471]